MMSQSIDTSRSTTDRSINLTDALLVFFLGGLKLFLVAPAIGPTSLYRDDAWQALSVRVSEFQDVLQTGVTSPGFAVLLRLVTGTDRVSEGILQIPAFIAGLLGPILVFAIARWWGLSRSASFIAGLLLCVAPQHTDYAARVKPYTLDAISTLVCLVISRLACDRPNKLLPWVGLVVVTSLSLLMSATAGLAGSAMVIAVATVRWMGGAKNRWKDLAILILFACFLGIWYEFILHAKSNDALRLFWQDRLVRWDNGLLPAIKSIVSNVLRVFASLIPDNTDTAIVPSAFLYLVPLSLLYGALALIGLTFIWRSNWRYGLLMIAPLVLAISLSIAGRFPLGGGRTDLYLAPIVTLMVANALDWRLVRSHSNSVAIILSGLLILAACVGARASYPREDLRSLTKAIEEQVGPNDRILVFPETTYMYALYSSARVRSESDPLSMTGFTPRLDDSRVSMMPGFQFGTAIHNQGESVCIALLEKAMSELPPKIWLIASSYFPEDTLPSLDKRLKENGWQEETGLHFENAAAKVWIRKSGSPIDIKDSQ